MKISSLKLAVFLSAILSAFNEAPAAESGCVGMTNGPTVWLPLNGDVQDIITGTQGVLNGAPAFVTGKVGQGLSFDGADDSARIPASTGLDIGAGAGATVEMWINPSDINSQMAVIEWSGPTGSQLGLHIFTGVFGSGSLFANLIDTANAPHHISTPGGVLAAGAFHHVALTYDRASGLARIYVNGVSSAEANFGDIRLETRTGAWLGQRVVGTSSHNRFSGVLDEVSFYDRALGQAEIEGIFNAGNAGKCSAPVLPTFLTQPVSQSLLEGGNCSFSVSVLGTPPFAYQWLFGEQALEGATNATLQLSGVTVSQSGDYSVVVQNAVGSVTSVVAKLTVNLPPPCTAPSAGIAGWWPFQQDGGDLLGGGSVVFTGTTNYIQGIVGDAIQLGGSGNTASVPASQQINVGAADGFTVEGWIKPASVGQQALVEWNNRAGSAGVHFYLGQDVPLGSGAGCLFANIVDVNNQSHHIRTPAGLVSSGTWNHVALSYDKSNGVAAIYVNGVEKATQVLGIFTPQTAPPFDLLLGHRIGFGGVQFSYNGGLDELSIYARALSSGEVQAIHHAGASGKCSAPFPPQIVSAPQNRTATRGETVTFTVGASGSTPMFYQWSYNGSAIESATNSALVLPDVQLSQAGAYSVTVSNAVGFATNSAAALTVNLPAASVWVLNTTGAAASEVTIPIVLAANGNENALGFSIMFNPQLMTYADVTLGSGAPSGASLLINTNDVAAGRLGLVVGLPADAVFSEGTQQIAQVTFLIAPIFNQTTVTLRFGDQPTLRQLAGAQAQILPANFVAGTLTIADSQFEGDVAPRPNGDRSLTTVDWVQMGRYVARLDEIGGTNEFQRADCAPRSTKGNGRLTASDWVQAGRYAVGLDTLTSAGGPTEPAPEEGGITAASPSGRRLALSDTAIVQGQTNSVGVSLDCIGNENAVSFSVQFDAAKLRYVGVGAGTGSSGLVINFNTNDAANGHIGVAIAAVPGANLGAGTRQLCALRFAAVVDAPASALVGFGNVPVPRDVSDVVANSLPTDYIVGTVNVTAPSGPPLQISRSGNSFVVTWPASATGFVLEATDGKLGTSWTPVAGVITFGDQKLAVLSATGQERYLRLKKP